MLKVNSTLFEPANIYNFINTSITTLYGFIPSLTQSPEYLLFFFVKDDFSANWSWLQYADIDLDFMGFPLIRRNTRHAIESFLDLHNLCIDSNYMSVLKYCSKQDKNAGIYGKYLFDGQFTIQSKCNIAKNNISNCPKYAQYLQKLVDEASECNKFTHPNIFLNIISTQDLNKKRHILCNLLNINIELLTNAYSLILKKFYQGVQPYLKCCPNMMCNQCYQDLITRFYSCVNNNLLINTTQTTFNFRTM